MSRVEVFPRPLMPHSKVQNPLPQLLQTPSGLALLEMQGTINLPSHNDENSISTESQSGVSSQETPVGRLIFPDYDPADISKTAWMKRVYLYVGKHQRLTGEVKKLPKALAVIRRRGIAEGRMDVDRGGGDGEEKTEQLEVVEIVKYKIIFSIRPEPVGTWDTGGGA
ncbi:sister chromatid cohesion protein Ctf8 [Rhexocercosporidium sp. MPI-PUGE-AT-0058]|nr:sister chromatid cohesion protein Ctf8 [Rhexocercosporidium sp. MPI-PUGE-AT-0058]